LRRRREEAATPRLRRSRRSLAQRRRRLCRRPPLKAWRRRRYTVGPRGCGGIGRRARFRSVWGKPRGGSSPLIRIGPYRCRNAAGGVGRPLDQADAAHTTFRPEPPVCRVARPLPSLERGKAGHPAWSPGRPAPGAVPSKAQAGPLRVWTAASPARCWRDYDVDALVATSHPGRSVARWPRRTSSSSAWTGTRTHASRTSESAIRYEDVASR
jgi:hypothetical protein